MQSSKALVVSALIISLILILFFLLPKNLSAPSPTPVPTETPIATQQFVSPDCKIGGCSNQLCLNLDAQDQVTTCEYADYYACYQTAACEKQQNGKCGWTQTEKLEGCIANPPKLQNIEPSL